MSESNERNLEGAAPEAAENMQPEATVETAGAANIEEKPNEKARAGKSAAEKTAPRRKSKGGKKRKGKKKRRQHGVIAALAIALVVAMLLFGILLGYGLGRVRREREASQEPADMDQLIADFDAPSDFDAFTEEMTNENQRALDALSGAAGAPNGDALALMGENSLLDPSPEETPEAEPVVVAEFGDGEQLMSDAVLERYNERLTSYILSGYSQEEVTGTLLDETLRDMVAEQVTREHAAELGLDELTDDDRAQIEAQAQEQYDEYAEAHRDEVDTSGKTEEEAASAVETYLRDYLGVDREDIRAQLEENWWQRKLRDALTEDVIVDDAAVQAAYDQRLAEQKASYAEYPDDYEFAQRSGEIIVYNPAGYRAVKVLLLGFDNSEAAMAVYALSGSEERQGELDAFYAGPEARAREALEKLRGGADMDEMIDEIGEDAGMKDARQRAEGYYVSANSTFWSQEFVDAAMALENVGDYSEPVRTGDGVCVLQYLGEVPEGAVALDDVRDALEAEVLAEAQERAYDEQVQAWVDEAQPSYYPERMQAG